MWATTNDRTPGPARSTPGTGQAREPILAIPERPFEYHMVVMARKQTLVQLSEELLELLDREAPGATSPAQR